MKLAALAARLAFVAVAVFASTGCGDASERVAGPRRHVAQACIDEDGDGICADADCDDDDDTIGVDCPAAPPPKGCKEGASRECKVELGEHNGVKSCFVGVEVCEDGEWTVCGEKEEDEDEQG